MSDGLFWALIAGLLLCDLALVAMVADRFRRK